MFFSTVLPYISQKAAEFAVKLGVSAAKAMAKPVVSAFNHAVSASGEAIAAVKAAPGNVAGWLGEWKPFVDNLSGPGSAEFQKQQAIREYNALMGTTSTEAPEAAACMPCAAASKGARRKARQDLIRAAQNKAAGDIANGPHIRAVSNQLAGDMDRVEDARLALHTYTANDKDEGQPEFLHQFHNVPPPGFSRPSNKQVADDFGVDPDMLERMTADPNSSQKIIIYQRDESVLGPGPKYTIAFRGSTSDKRDWNNNSRNEFNGEAPHQSNAIQLGQYLNRGAAQKGKSMDSLISATGHSKGGSEAQAFAAAAGVPARVFNPAGFDPSQYSSLKSQGVSASQMRIDRTSVINRDSAGNVIENGTDPLYYSQHEDVIKRQLARKKPVTTGKARELAPVAPSLMGPGGEKSNSEAHSMLQVIESLEREKDAEQKALEDYVAGKSSAPLFPPPASPGGNANSTRARI